MPSPFPCSPVIYECSWKKTHVEKKIFCNKVHETAMSLKLVAEFLAESFAIIWNYIVAPLEKMLLLFYIGRTIGFLSGYTIWNFVKIIRHIDNEVLTFSQCFFLCEWYAEWNRKLWYFEIMFLREKLMLMLVL